ncbi:hypothetical protein BVRB_016830 [Beta vulgaris subsp. vulgaris]|uniref:Reverse transcriptase Ty1/copia-type domain-containing protein n=1 Tax=Beta vulgaris subsp. vulgaris TaxID=3555 RepID=A0A0J8DUX2_BETVV|nr:hypothetical protein BVRB_016830 [Beta vulgaris subsp. vulgaris]
MPSMLSFLALITIAVLTAISAHTDAAKYPIALDPLPVILDPGRDTTYWPYVRLRNDTARILTLNRAPNDDPYSYMGKFVCMMFFLSAFIIMMVVCVVVIQLFADLFEVPISLSSSFKKKAFQNSDTDASSSDTTEYFDAESELLQTRSGRIIKPNNRYTPPDPHRHQKVGFCVYSSNSVITPQTYRQAISSKESDAWHAAMVEELSSHKNNKTWDLVTPPLNANIVGSNYNNDSGAIHLSQGTNIRQILSHYNMSKSKSAPSPMLKSSADFMSAPAPSKTIEFPYRECIGSLMYAAVCTRPDIATAVNICARFVSNPSDEHVTALKRILRYLQSCPDLGIQFSSSGNNMQLQVFVDADFASDKDNRRSVSGSVFMLNGSIYWMSKRQSCVSLSTTEAEYISASAACKELIWCRRLLNDIGLRQSSTLMFDDNQATIALAVSESVTRRCKHIDLRHHYIRELLRSGVINLQYCRTDENLADLMTKPLEPARFQLLRKRMMEVPPEEGVGAGVTVT